VNNEKRKIKGNEKRKTYLILIIFLDFFVGSNVNWGSIQTLIEINDGYFFTYF
jgi:hypothetical protein